MEACPAWSAKFFRLYPTLTSQVLTDTGNLFPAGSRREIYWYQMCVHNDYLNTSLHIFHMYNSQENVHVQLKKSGGMDNYSVKKVKNTRGVSLILKLRNLSSIIRCKLYVLVCIHPLFSKKQTRSNFHNKLISFGPCCTWPINQFWNSLKFQTFI